MHCHRCPTGKCAGHYLEASKAIKLYRSSDPEYKPKHKPPNEMIREFYQMFGNNAQEIEIEKLAGMVMLPAKEVWYIEVII
jgi:hypothetical protein